MPLDGRGQQRFGEPRPQLTRDRRQYVFIPGLQGMPENVAPKVLNKPHSITADVDIPKGGAEGVLACQGSNQGGYALYVKNKKLCYVHNYVGAQIFTVTSNVDVPRVGASCASSSRSRARRARSQGKGAPGLAQLYFDGRLVESEDVAVTTPLSLGLTSPLTVGEAPGAPVCPDVVSPCTFTGTVHSVKFDVTGDLIEDDELTLRRLMARQ